MIYIDSTALVKLAITEPESGALASWLAERSEHPLVSSTLHQAEVLRAIWRAEPAALPRGQRIIRRIQRVVLSQEMLDNAATVAPRKLGTAGAIHLASAIALRRDLVGFVTYDKALYEAAANALLPVARPVP
ncbi:MAG: type II toxin-antitoxin system VapC family toxin [Nocardiopsaceae bacterium]|nr:type II toxin-antitoxin system VapC family toxin [Nocardiopsaceae bacterium]